MPQTLPTNIATEILHDIMGMNVGSDSLVDAENEKDLREKLCDLKERWDQFEIHHHSVPQGKLVQPILMNGLLQKKHYNYPS